ncbi:flagellin [Polynucleobacter sp. UB-Piko-W3]|uniref:flagellin N-terminal helical domain-containing protein n=1 Tax=Polynucleobacter sp. UB-Piko-W3 TaxID=1819735 RepID=UPI001C0D00BF|nr:flagellin [Polynucleobacter sp. UB-Piko-W3]MBU3554988.1 flagellin [Polynucleobacter sp. UB-Piko-W3]
MSTVINTNLASLYAQNNLSGAQNALASSVMRLSSGLRINSAKDDAAGLAISQNMQGQINSVNQSVRNLNDATNLIQVADTSMSTIHDMLLRMKQLATQGYDGSLSGAQKMNIMDEIKQLNTEINNTAERTKFNGNSLINVTTGITGGTLTNGEVVGTTGTITNLASKGTLADTYTITISGSNITLTGATSLLAQTKTIATGSNGGKQEFNFDTLGISFTMEHSGATVSTAAATSLNTLTVIVGGSNPSLDFQAGADTQAANLISYQTINVQTTSGTGSNAAMTDLGTQITTVGAYTGATATTSWASGFNTLGTNIDTAINYISDQRSVMGSLINRISYISTNLQAQSTNLQSSKSAITDTDFAAETAKLTKGQIMQQAATAMLAQANQMPNVVLSLLK